MNLVWIIVLVYVSVVRNKKNWCFLCLIKLSSYVCKRNFRSLPQILKLEYNFSMWPTHYREREREKQRVSVLGNNSQIQAVSLHYYGTKINEICYYNKICELSTIPRATRVVARCHGPRSSQTNIFGHDLVTPTMDSHSTIYFLRLQ